MTLAFLSLPSHLVSAPIGILYGANDHATSDVIKDGAVAYSWQTGDAGFVLLAIDSSIRTIGYAPGTPPRREYALEREYPPGTTYGPRPMPGPYE